MMGRTRTVLVGRDDEVATLAHLLDDVRDGASRALVIEGEPGIGKTALLSAAAAAAAAAIEEPGFRMLRTSGAESDIDVPFAALQQLCAPVLALLDTIPGPQAAALQTTFGITTGPVPDRFLVGLGVLSLFAEAGRERPVLCLVDDHQWLDTASAQVLSFVARRVGAESIAMLFATRDAGPDLDALPRLTLAPLAPAQAAALLDESLPTKLDPRVREQLLAETSGNPLALIEAQRDIVTGRLAGGFGLPAAMTVTHRLEETFTRRIRALPPSSRLLLLLAATEPTGDPALLWEAARRLRIPEGASSAPAAAGLLDIDVRVRFRHPVVRSAVYHCADRAQVRRVHATLADCLDPEAHPDRRAWHLAQSVDEPDERVAEELERSSGRAQARGGLSAAGAFLQRAAVLTPEPGQRTRRALAAAQLRVLAGDFDAATELVASTEAGAMSEQDRASADIVRGHLAFATARGKDAPALFLDAARRLLPVDPPLARSTFLDAIWTALFAARLADDDANLTAVSNAGRLAAEPPASSAFDSLCRSLLTDFTGEYVRGLPGLQAAFNTGAAMSAEEELRLVPLAATAASGVWNHPTWRARSDRFVELCRDLGSLTNLPLALTSQAFQLLFAGDLRGAAAVVDEVATSAIATGSNLAPYAALALAAFRGDVDQVTQLARATLDQATKQGEGWSITAAEWASALAHNAAGHYAQAREAALRATAYDGDLGLRTWALAELVEAAARSEAPETAARGLATLVEMTTRSGTDWALSVEARSRALLSADEDAEVHYKQAIELITGGPVAPELGRAHLLYGEWLRRQRRRSDARRQLETALEIFEDAGLDGFAERTRRELWATGGAPQAQRLTQGVPLTAQEVQVANLARRGLTNQEIGTRMFISARTVEYHLGKIFGKLGITSRAQLSSVLD